MPRGHVRGDCGRDFVAIVLGLWSWLLRRCRSEWVHELQQRTISVKFGRINLLELRAWDLLGGRCEHMHELFFWLLSNCCTIVKLLFLRRWQVHGIFWRLDKLHSVRDRNLLGGGVWYLHGLFHGILPSKHGDLELLYLRLRGLLGGECEQLLILRRGDV